jgi:hypothetical protein
MNTRVLATQMSDADHGSAKRHGLQFPVFRLESSQ